MITNDQYKQARINLLNADDDEYDDVVGCWEEQILAYENQDQEEDW
jgi:hypothetical protein